MGIKILVVDDEATMCNLLKLKLTPLGYEVREAYSGKEGLQVLFEFRPDLIVLDVVMPEMDGFEFCQRVREMTKTPILFLTARGADDDVLRGFRLGADDYLRKPFNLDELVARVEAVLRRAGIASEVKHDRYDDGNLTIDVEAQVVERAGQPVHLSQTEFKLLAALVKRRGSVVPHDKLLEEVWGYTSMEVVSSLNVYIRYLRTKLEDNPSHPRYIRTEWGLGYIFVAQPPHDREIPSSSPGSQGQDQ